MPMLPEHSAAAGCWPILGHVGCCEHNCDVGIGEFAQIAVVHARGHPDHPQAISGPLERMRQQLARHLRRFENEHLDEDLRCSAH